MFFKLLETNSVLRRLYLRNNHFEREAAKWFRDALATNESLRILDLSWNHLRLMGAIWICEGVQVWYQCMENSKGYETQRAQSARCNNTSLAKEYKGDACYEYNMLPVWEG